jgi:hypothetical protein
MWWMISQFEILNELEFLLIGFFRVFSIVVAIIHVNLQLSKVNIFSSLIVVLVFMPLKCIHFTLALKVIKQDDQCRPFNFWQLHLLLCAMAIVSITMHASFFHLHGISCFFRLFLLSHVWTPLGFMILW